MSEREQFEAWWKTTGRALCGCSLAPDHTSPNQVFAARGFGAGFAAGFEAARAQPAQAGQVLTDEQIDVMWAKQQTKPFKTHGEDRIAFARAIEQAVRAKMGAAAPMDDGRGPPSVVDLCDPRGPNARLTEPPVAYGFDDDCNGIVGEKGGA